MKADINYPIQMICVISTFGDITPMRFRYEDENHSIITVNIDEVHARKEEHIAGVTSIIFTCSATISDRKSLFNIKYSIQTHKWIFMRRLS